MEPSHLDHQPKVMNPMLPQADLPNGPDDSRRDEDEIDLFRLFSVVWRGRYIVASISFFAFGIGVFVAASSPPVFQADALIQLEERSGRLAIPEAMQDLMAENPRTATEIELLRSRTVIGRVVADLDLDLRVEALKAPLFGEILSRYPIPVPDLEILRRYARLGERVVLEQLSVPPGWIGEPIHLIVTNTGFQVDLPDGSVRSARVGETLLDAASGFSLTVATIEAPPGRRYVLRQVDQSQAISLIRSSISVSERGRLSSVLEVRVTGADRMSTVRILDGLLEAYVTQNINRSAAEAESSLGFIRAQLPQAEADLRAAEEALNVYRQEQASVDLSLETETLLGQITSVENEIETLRRQEDELRERFTPTHPTYRRLLEDRARLEDRLGDLRTSVGSLPETQQVILNLSRDVAVREQIYTQLLGRAQEIEVLRAGTVGNVRIVDTAVAAATPIAPRRSRIVLLAVILGAVGGTGLVLLRDKMRHGIQDPSELEQLGLPVFATIGYVAEADSRGSRRGHMSLLATDQPAHFAVEAFRSLRTGLHFGLLDARTRSIAITSSAPGVGKSFTAANLAVVAAQAGQRVCLVDADMRRGQLRRYFGVDRSHAGLAEVLAGSERLKDALVSVGPEGLSFLSTGQYPPNPSELLMRKAMADILEELDGTFDLVIIDTPPALAVTDPVIIGKSAGACLVVVRHDATPRGEVMAVLKSFERAQVRIAGAILNAYDPRKGRASYRYGYGYGYANRYEYRTPKK
jgi:tyrosine-protein kinase Etk/Wzc